MTRATSSGSFAAAGLVTAADNHLRPALPLQLRGRPANTRGPVSDQHGRQLGSHLSDDHPWARDALAASFTAWSEANGSSSS